MKKTKLRQIAFELVVNLDRTSSRDSFARFYDLAIKFLRNSKSSTRSLLISFEACNICFVYLSPTQCKYDFKNET